MKKIICMCLCLTMLFGLCACGHREGGGGSDAKKDSYTVNIYLGSDKISAKADDSYVREKVQEKFLKDRGIKLNLNVQQYSLGDFNQTMSTKMSSNDWDAAVGYIGQAGIDEIVISQNVCMEIGDLLDSYDSLSKHVSANIEATTRPDGGVYGIPSNENTKQFGILARKDYMDKTGYTVEKGHSDALSSDLAQDNSGKKKTLVTIDDFTDMMRRMKAQKLCNYPLCGYPWDLEYTITSGAFGGVSYMFKHVEKNADGSIREVVPGQLAPDYYDVLRYEYLWQEEKLWEEEAYTAQKISKVNAFVQGNRGIFVIDPEIDYLISVARQTKANNPQAEFVLIPPPCGVDENGQSNGKSGTMQKQSAVNTLVINKRSENAEVILEYLDWLVSDVANYNLATYGVENEHWVDAGEGKYKYPESKKDRYEQKPPYSGLYGLLTYDNFSEKIYDNYTEEEYGWIQQVRETPTFSNPADNMLFIGEETDMALNHQTAENDFFQDCLVKVWNGVQDPAGAFDKEVQRYKNTAEEYIKWLTDQYKLYAVSRNL